MSRKLKRTTEEAAAYFREQGCELLGEYTGAQHKMPYKCRCGRESTISWNDFTNAKRPRRCGHCGVNGRTKRFTLEEARSIFQERGCELLESEYKNGHASMRYKCKCGGESRISLLAFRHQEQHCKECGFEKNRKENHHAWVNDRDELRRRQLFRKKLYKALSSTLEGIKQPKRARTYELLGYDHNALRSHVESHPNWPIVKEGSWDLDHVFPIRAFLDHGIEDIALINCLENLQPLASMDNNRKKDRYDVGKFKQWIERQTGASPAGRVAGIRQDLDDQGQTSGV